jgi:PiT family inorganic phosphate transporter
VVTYILAIVVVAFVFDFINGFHDSANSIATIVGTRVLSPTAAVLWAAVFNFAAIAGSTAVAKAIATGFVDPAIVDPNLICAALLGAIVWNLITWFYGIPSSSSHALICFIFLSIPLFLCFIRTSPYLQYDSVIRFSYIYSTDVYQFIIYFI